LECIDLQAQLAALLQGEIPPPTESICQFERKIQSKRNESMRSLLDKFAPALRYPCQQYEPKLPTYGNMTYLEDEAAQADILLAARVARGETDAIMANDMDFHACLGDVSLSISEFKYEQRNKATTNIVLAAASREE